MKFFPLILKPPFAVSCCQSLRATLSIWGDVPSHQSTPVTWAKVEQPSGVCVSTATARGAGSSLCLWHYELCPAALAPAPVTLQMQAAVILGTLVICVIYLVPLQALWSPEWCIILISSACFLCVVWRTCEKYNPSLFHWDVFYIPWTSLTQRCWYF